MEGLRLSWLVFLISKWGPYMEYEEYALFGWYTCLSNWGLGFQELSLCPNLMSWFFFLKKENNILYFNVQENYKTYIKRIFFMSYAFFL